MKKLMIFLTITIPLIIILIVNFTLDVFLGDVYIPVDSIELDQTNIEVNVDDSITLNYTISPKNATYQDVIWESSDDSVAVVDANGKVDFISYGYGYITAKTQNGKRASCYFYSTDDKPHKVVLSAGSDTSEVIEVAIDGSLRLSAQVFPAEASQKVSYSSSKPDIAEVNQNGMVTPKSIGYTTITVTTDDGVWTDSKEIAVVIPVTRLVVDTTDVVCAAPTYRVQCEVLPENATNQALTYQIDNEEIAQVSQWGLITFKKAGQCTLTITSVSGKISKQINFTYTAGYASQLEVAEPFISATIGDAPRPIEYQVTPKSVTAEVRFASENEEVAYVDETGYLQFVGGGDTVIHVMINKNETEVLRQDINVHVEDPAQGIIIDDEVITASPQVQLMPTSYPETSTNKNFYYHSLSEAEATVSPEGLVTFLTDKSTTVEIKIFANSDESDVSKTVRVVYTAGKASDFNLVQNTLELYCGQTQSLNYNILPYDSTAQPEVKLLSSAPNVPDMDVIEISDEGAIIALNGGTAIVEAQITLYDGTIIKQQCNIIVIRQPSRIEIDLGLDRYNGNFVTASRDVMLNAHVLPKDTSDKQIAWSVNDASKAIITNGQLIFNDVGIVALTATCGEVSSTINVYYTGSSPLFAEIGADFGTEKRDIPQSIEVGQSFEVYIKSIFPSGAQNQTIMLSTTNESTSSISNHVLAIEGTRVTAMAGGMVTLVVNISNTIHLTFDIKVIKKPESLIVTPANTQVTADTIELIATVSPQDTTLQEVRFTLEETEIASLDNNILRFTQNGIVYLHAYCVADENVNFPFYIEKIEKDVIMLRENTGNIDVHKGDVMAFELSEQNYSRIELESSVQNVVKVDGQYLRAVGVGYSDVKCAIYQDELQIKTILVRVNVTALVEQIVLKNDIDFVNGEYVVASEMVDLNFDVLPMDAANKSLQFVIESNDTIGLSNAYMLGSTLCFRRPGIVNLIVTSEDTNAKLQLRFRYTGGDAISATLNIEEHIELEIGQSITINVEKWVPKDTQNTTIMISDISTAISTILSVNSKTRTVTAVAGGEGRILVELSNGLSKEIVITIMRKVSSIQIESEIVSANEVITLNAQALPTSATNPTLNYSMDKCDFATLVGNVLTFTKPGQVSVLISATDGSGITKTVLVTSTFGYYNEIKLNLTQKQLRKNEAFNLYVTQKLPGNATRGEIKYKILTMVAADGTDNEVISLLPEGKITALYGGSATVRVYTEDYYGDEVYADCEVEVFVPVTSIDIKFARQLDTYQSAYITAQDTLEFSVAIYPADASIRTYTYQISDPSAAEIEDGKIVFKTGNRVTIKFISDDNSQGERSKSCTFYYFGDGLIEANIDKSQIEDGRISLKAGETFKFIVTKTLPSDNQNLQFTIQNVIDKGIDENKQVAFFADGVLHALNGGEYDFTLYINNLNIGNFTLIVTRDANDIEISGETNVYISQPYYQINAKILPSDAIQNDLGYRCASTKVHITERGEVTFTAYGKYEIEIYVKSNPQITKSILIEYTKELRAIRFNETRDKMYVNEFIYLSIIAQPYDADTFTFSMSLDNNSIAQLTKQDDGSYQLTGLASGEVNVTAKVDGKDISVSKKFVFYDQITNIQLELDSTNDANGHGEYRYWGNEFIQGDLVVNTYKMNLTLKPSTAPLNLLEWSSNNESIATVDENGVVTFCKNASGKVKITVSQRKPYDDAPVESDSYEFIVVNGINVSSLSDFAKAKDCLKTYNKDLKENYYAIVLHNDIIFDKNSNEKSLLLDYNVYGNGHMIDFEYVENKEYNIFTISRSNIVVDNVTLRGHQLASGSALSMLDGTGHLLEIVGSENVLLYNAIFENCDNCVRVIDSSVTINGCILRNALTSGASLWTSNPQKGCVLTVKNSIFSNILLCGILFEFDETQNPHTLILEGEVRFYNWVTLDEIERGFKSKLNSFIGNSPVLNSVMQPLISQIRDVVAKQENYCYGGKYYNVAVLEIHVDLVVDSYNGNGNIDRTKLNSGCNYSELVCEGKINALAGTATFRLKVLSLSNSSPFIKPGDTYENDRLIMSRIIQPSRF